MFVPQFVDELIGLFSDLYAFLFACFVSMVVGLKGMLFDLLVSLYFLGSEGIAIDRTLFGDRSHVILVVLFIGNDRSLLRFLATGTCDRSHPIGRSIAQMT